MEQRLNRILAWNAGNREAKDTIQEDVRLLDEYYKTEQTVVPFTPTEGFERERFRTL